MKLVYPRASIAALGALLGATGCSLFGGSLPPPPEDVGRQDPVADQRFGFARSVARHGAPSPTPHLDALAELAQQTTPELGLDDLAGARGGDAAVARLRPGDVIEVTVVSHPEFGGQRAVGPDGKLSVASLGPFDVTGLSPEQVGARIRSGLQSTVLAAGQKPTVTVSILERAPRAVQVLGRVAANIGQPAGAEQNAESLMATEVPLPPDRPLSVYGLISAVQGLAADADERRLVLIRKTRPRGAEDGGGGEGPLSGACRAYHFTFRELVSASLSGREAWLEPDDQLLVPRLPDIYVYGAVAAPGRHPLRPDTTVASLLLQVGGVNELAEVGRVLLLQGDEVKALGSDQLDQVLEPGQVVFVPAGERVYVVGAGVGRNGPLILPHTGLTALQAVAEAGWFTPLADLGGVEILRREESGRVRIPVPVEAILEGERDAEAYQLRAGDTVLVPESAW